MRRFYYWKRHERKMFIPCWNADRVGHNTEVKLWRVIAAYRFQNKQTKKNKSMLDTIEVIFYSNRGPPTKNSHNVSKATDLQK